MAIPYKQILRMAGIKANAIAGVTESTINANYIVSTLSATELGSVDFPFSSIKDALVSVLGRIIRTYASVPNHPFRAYNMVQTDSIANKGLIPSVSSSGSGSKPIVGVYGAVKEATSPAQTVTRSGDTLTSAAAHGLSTGSEFRLSSTVAIPAPLQTNTTYFAIVTSSTTFKAALSLNDAIIGTFITLTSGGSGTITETPIANLLTKMPSQIVQTIVDNPDTQLKGNYYYYDIIDDRLFHTRANAVIDVVTFSASDILTGMGTLDDADAHTAPIPDACLDMAWTGLLSTLFVDDEFLGQAQMCAQYFENCLAEMKAGAVSFAPAPVMTTSAAQ